MAHAALPGAQPPSYEDAVMAMMARATEMENPVLSREMHAVSVLEQQGQMEAAVAKLERLHRQYLEAPSPGVALGHYDSGQEAYRTGVRYFEEALWRILRNPIDAYTDDMASLLITT